MCWCFIHYWSYMVLLKPQKLLCVHYVMSFSILTLLLIVTYIETLQMIVFWFNDTM